MAQVGRMVGYGDVGVDRWTGKHDIAGDGDRAKSKGERAGSGNDGGGGDGKER